MPKTLREIIESLGIKPAPLPAVVKSVSPLELMRSAVGGETSWNTK